MNKKQVRDEARVLLAAIVKVLKKRKMCNYSGKDKKVQTAVYLMHRSLGDTLNKIEDIAGI